MEKKKVFEYFYTENTTGEWDSDISGRYTSFNAAREALKGESDWYCGKDTGRIYRCTVYEQDKELRFDRVCVFQRTQRDALNNLPGTYYKK